MNTAIRSSRPSALAHGLAIVGTLVAIFGGVSRAAEPPKPPALPTAADFARFPDISQVSVSPDGRYLALVVHDGDDATLTVLSMATRKPIAGMDMKFYQRRVGSYVWESPTRLVISPVMNDDFWGEVHYTGELLSLDVPTNSSKYLLGYEAQSAPQIGTRIGPRAASSRYNNGYGFVLSATPETPGSVIVVTRNWGGKNRQQVQRLDTDTGAIAPLAASPVISDAYAGFLTDQQGVLRYAYVSDIGSEREYRLFRRAADDTAWVEARDLTEKKLSPTWITRDGVWTYFTSDNEKLPGRFCLHRQHTDGRGPLEEVTCQDNVEFLDFIEARDGNSIIATYAEPGMPSLNVLADGDDMAAILDLQASLDNVVVLPESKSRDGRFRILRAASARDPGTYYLYDHETKKYEELFHAYDKMPIAAMRPTRAVRYDARDGTVVRGFLTLPTASTDGRKPSLVVLPHGGPIGPRDDWFYDQETQLLATRGYAVLRVNFRGSGGYGTAFQRVAKRQWGKAMIDDITDGVRHVIKEGLVDANRVGIYGASYGGYAALMSGVREPDLYKAVVTFAGVSDLEKQTKDSDTAENDQGVLYMGKYIGDDPAELKAQSPLTHIDKLKAPVLIVHGKEDERVPFSQAETLRDALDARHHPYEWFVRSSEGHGFFYLKDRQAFNETLLSFLEANLKNRPAAPVASASATTKP